MAVLFSAVTLTADNNQVEFLAAGIPRDSDDLEGWTAYENFMDELDSEQEVSVHVEAYLYGEGETFKATPEEVAYFKMRADADEECQCNRVEICRSRLGEAYQQLIDHEIARRIVKPVGAQKARIGDGAARRKRAPKAKLLC